MTVSEKALNYIRQLNLIEELEENFVLGKTMQSKMNSGILFPADAKQQEKIREIEEDFPDSKVWHIISDNLMIEGENVRVDSYLLAIDDGDPKLEEIDGGFLAFAYIDNVAIPEYCEYGEMLIAEQFGGIIRIS